MARVSDPRKGKAPPKAKAVEVSSDGYLYRSRPTLPGPFGDEEPPYEGPLADVIARADVDREAGMEPVLEYRVPGVPWMTWLRPMTLADLANLGHAREITRAVKRKEGGEDDPTHGETRDEKRWEITEEGQRLLGLAARGELPPSAWARVRP